MEVYLENKKFDINYNRADTCSSICVKNACKQLLL